MFSKERSSGTISLRCWLASALEVLDQRDDLLDGHSTRLSSSTSQAWTSPRSFVLVVTPTKSPLCGWKISRRYRQTTTFPGAH